MKKSLFITGVMVVFLLVGLSGFFIGSNWLNEELSNCGKKSFPYERNICITETAKQQQDASLCEKITEVGARDACLRQVGIVYVRLV